MKRDGSLSPRTNRWIVGIFGGLLSAVSAYFFIWILTHPFERSHVLIAASFATVGVLFIALARFGSNKIVEDAAGGI